MATKVNRVQLLCIFDAFLMGEAWSSLHYEMGSLGKDLCHRRTPTGSGFFAKFGSGFAEISGQVVSIRAKTLSFTNLTVSR